MKLIGLQSRLELHRLMLVRMFRLTRWEPQRLGCFKKPVSCRSCKSGASTGNVPDAMDAGARTGCELDMRPFGGSNVCLG